MVIKVLEKAFAILEFIVLQQGKPVRPAELSKALNLNQPTCIRLLKDLVEAGYLVQVSRTQGYISGPTAVWFGRFASFQKELTQISESIIREAALHNRMSILVAVRHDGYRVLLAGVNGSPDVKLNMNFPRRYDLFEAATGRLLLAHTPQKELDRIIAEQGVPNHPAWGGKVDRSSIDLVLHRIRREGIVNDKCMGVEACAVPITSKGKTIAALGGAWRTYVGKEKREHYIEVSRNVASEISAAFAGKIIQL